MKGIWLCIGLEMLFRPGNIDLPALQPEEAKICRARAEASVRDLLDGNEACSSIGALEEIRATRKSQIYAFRRDGHALIAKRHELPVNWRREYQAYLLFRGGPIPDLIRADERSGLLILSHEGSTHFDAQRHSHGKLVRSVALLHRAAARNLEVVMANVESGAATDRTAVAPEQHWPAEFASEVAAIWGDAHVPVSIADLKPGHVLVGKDEYRIIDLETTMIGRPELYDLLCVMNFFESRRCFVDAWDSELADIYIRYRGLGCDKERLCDAMWRYNYALNEYERARPEISV